MYLRIKAYRAIDVIDKCKQNFLAHALVLQKYDIGNITSAKRNWWENNETFVLLLEDSSTAEQLGAVRLQRWGNGISLPIETAVSNIDNSVHEWVASFASEGVGELCGLWCSPTIKGLGIGISLTRMGLAIASALQIRTILALCDTRYLIQNIGFGFARDTSLVGGTFEYPRPGLFAHVLRIADSQKFEGANLSDRIAIENYRNVPVGVETISHINLERDLRLAPIA